MARIEGEIAINRPVDEVFDFVADERNEPRYNPKIARVEKLSDGPIGVTEVADRTRLPAYASDRQSASVRRR